MLRVNLDTGQTVLLDLEAPDDAERWRVLAGAGGITGLQLVVAERAHALPRPPGGASGWDADVVADRDGRVVRERAVCYTDRVRVVLTVYRSCRPVASRVDVERVGRLRLKAPPRGPG